MKKRSNMLKIVIGAVAAVAVVIIALAFYQTAAPKSVIGDGAIESEISRLNLLAASGTIITDDLVALRSMIEGDRKAAREFEEVEAMVGYGEYAHASHALGFLGSYVNTGKDVICPEHEISHFYVFSKHNNSELAAHSLEHAQEHMHEWEEKAEEFLNQFPGSRSFEEVAANLEFYMHQIDAGNITATDSEVLDLANRAICVEAGDGTHED